MEGQPDQLLPPQHGTGAEVAVEVIVGVVEELWQEHQPHQGGPPFVVLWPRANVSRHGCGGVVEQKEG